MKIFKVEVDIFRNLMQIDKKILKQLVVLAIPIVISQGAFALMIFTDRYFLSLISPLHMAAGLGGGFASFFSMSLFIGILSYSNALVAQYYGLGERKKCSLVLTQSMLLCVAFIPLLALLTYLVSGLFALMGHSAEQVELEKSYYLMLMIGAIFALVKTSFASYFTGIGMTKVVMLAEIFSVVVNIPFSYILIFGKLGMPELGIVGAAISTVGSVFIAIGIFLFFYFLKEHRILFGVMQSFHVNRKILIRYLRLGIPSGVELFLNVAAFHLFLLMFQSYGLIEAASAAIVLNLDVVSFVPLLGLNAALISMVGGYVGSNNMSKIDQVIKSGFILGLGYTSVLAIIFILFRVDLVSLFLSTGENSQAILTLSTFMMVGMASYVMADSIILVCSGVLRGAGDTKWLMKTSIALHWLMLLAQFIVIKHLALDAKYSWIMFIVLLFSIAITYFWRLKSGAWRDEIALQKVMTE